MIFKSKMTKLKGSRLKEESKLMFNKTLMAKAQVLSKSLNLNGLNMYRGSMTWIFWTGFYIYTHLIHILEYILRLRVRFLRVVC